MCREDSLHIEFKPKKILLFKTYHLYKSVLRYPGREPGKRRNPGLGEGPGDKQEEGGHLLFIFVVLNYFL